MRRTLSAGVSALVLVLAASPASHSQPAPFDMSPEVAPDRSAEPPEAGPSATPARPMPSAPGGPAPAEEQRSLPTPLAPQPASADRRYILPMESLTLGGETATRRWGIVLSDVEAARAQTFRIGYQNSILVAPEASDLRFVVNGRTVIDTPVQAAEGVGIVEVDVPGDLLEAGLNTIEFDASLRHRTDCTIESTYDLWTEIEAEESYIALEGRSASDPRPLEDLRAVGFDVAGRTRYRIVVPEGALARAARPGVRLSQGLALLAAMPNPAVTFFEGDLPAAEADGLTIVAGPAEAIAALVPGLPPEAERAAFAGFVDLGGSQVLVVSGPDWPAVDVAVEEVVAPTDRPMSVTRTRLSEPGWRSPDPPLLFGATSLAFRDLGIPTQEFSGRLFRTSFAVGVPADFYAEAYGEATILIDAAYSSAVRPGSRIDVYVNGDIATTLPIGSASGAVLRRYPVPITLRHFRPGANVVTIEAVLDTEEDALCLPGTATGADTRFALFDSSTFEMPDFARISRRPELSALSGVGFPYNRVDGAIPLVLAEPSAETLSAAATFAARIALVAGRPLAYEMLPPASATGRDAVFVGPAPRLASGILPQVGIADTIRLGWGSGPADPAAPATAASMARWQEEVGVPWRRPFAAFADWLEARFDLSLEALRLTPAPSPPYVPPADVSLIVAQGRDPSDEHTWTVVTAQNGEALAEGVSSLARQENWGELAGRLTVYDASQAMYLQIAAADVRLVPSVPSSFANLRLVAANWLSANALAYALVLALASLILGGITSVLTSVLGRRR